MAVTQDVKGTPVLVDSLVEGFIGLTKRACKARVTSISPWGWIVGYAADAAQGAQQPVFYEGRFLVRGDPRPMRERGDIPERLQR